MNVQHSPTDLFPVPKVDWEGTVADYLAAKKAGTHQWFSIPRLAETVGYMEANLHMTRAQISERFDGGITWVSYLARFNRLDKEAQAFFAQDVPIPGRLRIEELKVLLQAPSGKQAERAANLSRVAQRPRQRRFHPSNTN